MNHHADHLLGQTECGERLRIEHAVDYLHFQEVVARAERAALVVPPIEGPVADKIGAGALEAAAALREFEIALGRQPALLEELRPQLEQPSQLVVVELVLAPVAGPRRHTAKQLTD